MNIGILATDDVIRETLQKAFTVLDKNVQTYTSWEDMSEKEKPKILIACLHEDNVEVSPKWAEDIAVFILSTPDHVSNIEWGDMIRDHKMPVRLGHIVESVRIYTNSRIQKDKMKPVRMGNYTLDPKSNQLEDKARKQHIRLTEKEQDMLLFLYNQKGTPAKRQDILNHVWEYADGVETHTLETHIYRLRQKIEKDPAQPAFLMTDDKGYYLDF